ncbi:MAG: NAD(P)-binding protein [Bdellovibrionaceae bacterium]|nr:NAD(P)-binding protein [Pseudobdellovibrionaceae bacterium]
MHIYDYIVIGSGLAGVSVASKISKETQNVLLIESESVLGGSNKAAHIKYQNNNYTSENGLRFYPGSPMAKKALKNLEDELGLKLIKSTFENNPETYEASGFKSFVGFGDSPPEFYNEISYFLNSHEIELTLPVYKIVELLKEKYQGETLTKSFMTGFKFTEDVLTHVVVNGSKEYYAKNFIFAGTVRDLSVLLPDEALGIRAKTKLKKDTTWVGLCLDLLHEGTTMDKHNLFILDGTTNDSIGPCIGRFMHPQTDMNVQVSQWMSFIDLETSEETENIGEVLKKMKRQIKRAFPEMNDAIKAERLFMTPALSAGELKLNSNGTVAKVDNLWVASGQVNQFPNLLGSILQSQFVLSALGFGSVSVAGQEGHTELTETIQEISI